MAPPALSTDNPVKVWLAFWLAALFWGTSFLWIKLGLRGWNPTALVAFRLSFASLFFIAALVATRTRFTIPRRSWWIFAVVSLMNPFLPFLLISWAEVRIETGVTSILNATVPLFTLGFAPIFLPDERPTWRTFLGTFIGFIGVAILFGGQMDGADLRVGESAVQATGVLSEGMIGRLAVLLACGLYSFSSVLLRRFSPHIPPLAQAAMLNFGAWVYVCSYGTFSGQLSLPPASINWIATLWLGALGSFAAYTFGMYVMAKRGATQLGLINFAYPLFGMLLGIIFLGEAFDARLLYGGCLILGGIALVQKWKPLRGARFRSERSRSGSDRDRSDH